MKMGKVKNRVNQNIKRNVTLLTVYEIITKYVKKIMNSKWMWILTV